MHTDHLRCDSETESRQRTHRGDGNFI